MNNQGDNPTLSTMRQGRTKSMAKKAPYIRKDKGKASKPSTSKGKSHANPTINFDQARFRTAQHWEAYKERFSSRPLIKENRFALNPHDHSLEVEGERRPNPIVIEVCTEIQRRCWTRLCNLTTPAFTEIVHEFYANITISEEEDQYVSYVRGKEILFAPEVINALFEIPESREECYLGVRKKDKIHQEKQSTMNEILCDGQGSWVGSRIANRPICHLKTQTLNVKAKVWWVFVSTILLPIQHKSDVGPERLWCLLALMKRVPYINAGCTIAQEILELHRMNRGSLAYAGVISLLCMRAGVDVRSLAPLKPRRHICLKRTFEEKPPHRRPSPSKGKSPMEEGTSQRPSKGSSSSKKVSNERVLRNLHKVNANIRRIHDHSKVSVMMLPFLHVMASKLDVDVPNLVPDMRAFNKEYIEELQQFEELSDEDLQEEAENNAEEQD